MMLTGAFLNALMVYSQLLQLNQPAFLFFFFFFL